MLEERQQPRRGQREAAATMQQVRQRGRGRERLPEWERGRGRWWGWGRKVFQQRSKWLAVRRPQKLQQSRSQVRAWV